jgi:hypothetical protein
MIFGLWSRHRVDLSCDYYGMRVLVNELAISFFPCLYIRRYRCFLVRVMVLYSWHFFKVCLILDKQ